MSPLFSGSIVALITPFNSKGNLDVRALRSLVQWHVEQGTDGIVCAGTTGEGCSLRFAERMKLLEICLEEANGRLKVIAGAGVSDTRETVKLTTAALKAGADGALVVTPYYNRPTQEGCLAHFREVGKVGLPIIVYHNPARACFRFTVDSAVELGKIDHLVAFKDSSHDLPFVQQIVEKSGLSVFCGDDDVTFPFLQLGAVGSISVIGNWIPKSWKRMIDLALAKDWEQAKSISDRFMPLCKAMFAEPNPQGIKYLMAQAGRCLPVWRLPLLTPRSATEKGLKQEILKLVLPCYQATGKIGDKF